jgi:hypothetical protein
LTRDEKSWERFGSSERSVPIHPPVRVLTNICQWSELIAMPSEEKKRSRHIYLSGLAKDSSNRPHEATTTRTWRSSGTVEAARRIGSLSISTANLYWIHSFTHSDLRSFKGSLVYAPPSYPDTRYACILDSSSVGSWQLRLTRACARVAVTHRRRASEDKQNNGTTRRKGGWCAIRGGRRPLASRT